MELEIMLKALGEPMRLKIYQALLERKHCVRSLSKKLGISESAISQHLKVMKDAELVYGEKYGYHTHYLSAQDAVDFLMAQFEAVLRGLKPCVIGIVPATGIYMVLANCFGSVYAITVNARAHHYGDIGCFNARI